MNWLLLVGTYAIGYLDGYRSAKKRNKQVEWSDK